MTPYFERDGIALYHGDALSVLAGLGEVDLLLTDPPYGVEWQSGFRKEQFSLLANDAESDRGGVLEVLRTAVAKLPAGRHAYVFGPLSDAEADSLRLTRPAELIWDKVGIGAGDLSMPWAPQHERITFATSGPSASNRRDGRGALAARLRRGSILREQRANSTGVQHHPTEKPVGILRQMIESSTVLGDLVLDPFAGSGSTLVASHMEGRRAVGIEIEERYCEVAAKRLDDLTRQLTLAARVLAAGEGGKP